jgi:formylglycine-generating enzyme required for sulfatase activity
LIEEAVMKLTLIALVVLVLSCVHGKKPPEPTNLVFVKGGELVFGDDNACLPEDGDTSCSSVEQSLELHLPKVYPTAKVKVQDFYIEEHEVTNEQYRYCVLMGQCAEPLADNVPGFADNYYSSDAYKDFPVVNVSRDMAQKYCEFVGRRLPTEIEWERVAKGPNSSRVYPFDKDTGDVKACKGKDIATLYCSGYKEIRKVASSIDDYVTEGGSKIYDLMGNVAEWVAGKYEEGITCKVDLEEMHCTDCFTCTTNDCKSSCYFCDPCTSDTNCFKMCLDKPEVFPGIPICISYGDETLQGEDESEFLNKWNSGTEIIAKGGAFTDGKDKTCWMRVGSRNRHFLPSDITKFYNIGFRCAKDAD